MTRSPSSSSNSPSTDCVEDSSGIFDFFKSVMNQMRFGWTLALSPKFRSGVPIYFFGKQYFTESESGLTQGQIEKEMETFMSDFKTRIWFTYRESFPPLPVKNGPSVFSTLTQSPPYELVKTTAALRDHLKRRVYSGTANLSDATDSSESSSISPVKIPLSIRTSDCGWGCMLRCVQMLAAQTLLLHFLGRDWTFDPHKWVSAQESRARMHRKVVRWFGDSPESPLSLHRLLAATGSPPGTRFGPAAVCQALMVAIASPHTDPALSSLEVYLAHDRVICREEMLALFDGTSPAINGGRGGSQEHTNGFVNGGLVSGHNGDSSFSATLGDLSDRRAMGDLVSGSDGEKARADGVGVLLLVPMRLGAGTRIEAAHVPGLLAILRDRAFVGLIGGRPRHSVYVAGLQEDSLIHLDPHFCQDTVIPPQKVGPELQEAATSDPENLDAKFDLSSYHCSTPRLIPAGRLDPSLAVGFYCGSRGDAEALLDRLPDMATVRSSPSSYQLIEVVSASQQKSLFGPPSRSTGDEAAHPPYPPIDDVSEVDDGCTPGHQHDSGETDEDTCFVNF